ncbi:MAG: aminotransferase class III-fold pyridoxal phosphate-dependent enzyme, partial [Candidatus Margulisbacteria bacterium]|nr:aminotransferase class III-fold pyridoxal phosphate-dependent enzyme [Candidatus Margulisiibacteriota bacterium]
LARVNKNIALLRDKLEKFRGIPQVKQIRQCGMIAALELPEYAYKEKIGYRICAKARERGLLIRPLSNNIVIMPPLSTTARELRWLLDVIYQSIQETVGSPAYPQDTALTNRNTDTSTSLSVR